MFKPVKRYFQLFNIRNLLTILAVVYAIIWFGDNPILTTPPGKLAFSAVITFLILMINPSPLQNFKWVITGESKFLSGSKAQKREDYLKKARENTQKPLFVSFQDEYYYQEDGFKNPS